MKVTVTPFALTRRQANEVKRRSEKDEKERSLDGDDDEGKDGERIVVYMDMHST